MSDPFRLFMQRLALVICILWLPVCFSNETNETSFPEDTQASAPSRPPITLADKNFTLLKAELERYQTFAQNPWDPIPETTRIRIGKRNEYVPLLRERLVLTGDLNEIYKSDNTRFDKHLAEAVTRFQERHNLEPDGVPGKATLTELNVPPEARIKSIQINMQRWALLSKQLGDRFIIVNIPDYQLYLFDQGNQVLMMKVVVGKPDWQTPELTSKITRIVFNPSWNVPEKIATNDLLPKVRNDPYYLDDMHIKVYVNDNGRSQQVGASDINWENVQDNDSPYSFRQEPGEDNALGVVKFEFPNRYDVYLHDTPAKTLFDQPLRDLSHGCVRLEKPLDLVTYLMKDNIDWSEEKQQAIFDTHQTSYMRIKKPMPIFITYITVWTDENGVVNYRNDIYQRDI